MRKLNLTQGRMIFSIIALVFFAYSFMVNDSFKTLDDKFSIVENETIKSFANIPEVFTQSFFGGNSYYRPLVTLSFMAEYHLFGLDARYYYLTNILLHIISALVVFFLIKHLFADKQIAYFTALLFAIHPVHWEAVSNIPGRSILLCGLFYFSAFYFYVRYLEGQKLLAMLVSLLLFVCALLSKESGIVLPVLMGSYILCRSVKEDMRLHLVKTWPYFVVLAGYFLLRQIIGVTTLFHWRNVPEAILGFLTFLRSVMTHLRIFIFPTDLHFDRSRELFASFQDPQLLLTIIFFAGLIIVAIRFRNILIGLPLFFTTWFFIELIPVSQVWVSIGVRPGWISTAEHFLYTASVGIFVLMVLSGQVLYHKLMNHPRIPPRVSQIVFVGIFMLFFLTTVVQNIYSSSEVAMMKQTLKYDPHNTRIRNSVGLSLAHRGLYKEAETEFRKIVESEPTNVRARISLGKSLCDQGQYLACIEEYEKIPDAGSLQELLDNNKALTYEVLVEKYTEAINRNPGDANMHYSLGVVFGKIGQPKEAMKKFERAVILNPNHKNALFNLASSFKAQRNLVEAAVLLERVVNLDQPLSQLDVFAYRTLGEIYEELGQKERAQQYRESAQKLYSHLVKNP